MEFNSKEFDFIKLILLFSYLALGIASLIINFALQDEFLLIINAILLGLFIYDLNLPEKVVGIGKNKSLRMFGAIFGTTIPFLAGVGFIGMIATVLYFMMGIFLFTILNWKKIDWNGQNRIQKIFMKSLQKESKEDPELAKTKVVVFGLKKIYAIDYLKILTFLSLWTEGLLLIFLLSFFILTIGKDFVIEASLFALLTMWIIVTSFKLLLKKKWARFWDRRDQFEEKIWLSTVRQFSTLRKVYYFTFFIPSLLTAIAGSYITVVVYPQLIAAPLLVAVSDIETILRWLVSLAILWVWILATIYPFYITVKLFQIARTKKSVHLLFSPCLCLSLSIAFSFTLLFSFYISSIRLFNLITLDALIMAITTLALLVVWVRVIWMRIKRRYTSMTPRLERNLAIGMTVFSLPLYCQILDVVLVPAFIITILMLAIVFRLISLPLASHKAELKILISSVVLLAMISVYVLFFIPELNWVAILGVIGVLVLMIRLSPRRYRERLTKILFRTYKVRELD